MEIPDNLFFTTIEPPELLESSTPQSVANDSGSLTSDGKQDSRKASDRRFFEGFGKDATARYLFGCYESCGMVRQVRKEI
jgi:hypothetical protein